MIDLDSLSPDPDNSEPSDVSSALVFSEHGVRDQVDRRKKIIYVFDISASMRDRMMGLEDVSAYVWTPEVLRYARELKREASVRYAQYLIGLIQEDELEENDERWMQIPENANDEFLKASIVSAGLTHVVGAERDYDVDTCQTSKIDAVRKYTRKMIEERFDRFPDADVHIVRFAEEPLYRSRVSREDLLQELDSMDAYGTSTEIRSALDFAIGLCQKSPSEVMAHQIILVTDGKATDGTEEHEYFSLADRMRELRIVLDFIHLVSVRDFGYASDWEVLKKLAQDSGGNYTVIDRAADFESRFVEAARRVLLLT